MKVKELKDFINNLPGRFDDCDVCFASKKDALRTIDGANKSFFNPDEVPDGFSEDFILLWSGEKP